jgi:hypothetical protein
MKRSALKAFLYNNDIIASYTDDRLFLSIKFLAYVKNIDFDLSTEQFLLSVNTPE